MADVMDRYSYTFEGERPAVRPDGTPVINENFQMVMESFYETRFASAGNLGAMYKAGQLSLQKFEDGSVLAVYNRDRSAHNICLGSIDHIESGSHYFIIHDGNTGGTYLREGKDFTDRYTLTTGKERPVEQVLVTRGHAVTEDELADIIAGSGDGEADAV